MLNNNQIEAFDKVYKRYKWKCILTWESLQVKHVNMFAHILPKGAYPKMKNEDMNIVLVKDIEQHDKVDRIVNYIRKQLWKNYIIEYIKEWKDIAKLIQEYKDKV